MVLLHLLNQPIAHSGGHSQFKIMGQAKLIGDLHVFEHVLYGKVRLKIAVDHFWHFHRQSCRLTCVVSHRLEELF